MIKAKGCGEMIQFDRSENDRIYLGFSEKELDAILLVLEKHQPELEETKRLDALSMSFWKMQREKGK